LPVFPLSLRCPDLVKADPKLPQIRQFGPARRESSDRRRHEPGPQIAEIIPSVNGLKSVLQATISSQSTLVVHLSAVAADSGEAAYGRAVTRVVWCPIVTQDTCKP
jgi:hypothetical protein